MKLWGGRFSKETDAVVNDFNSSVSFDCRMYREDIEGSRAHACMLGETGIISKDEAALIVKTLGEILSDIEAGKIEFTAENEDIHMNIETLLTERIGNVGKKLHTARSRNDQVALDFRMYCKKETDSIISLAKELISVLISVAEANTETVMPGYTHLQRAQPVTFAHYMLAYAQMLRRDILRLIDCRVRTNELPLGAGALAGTTFPIDRNLVAEKLGFRKLCENSLDAVSDRDFALELLSCLAILMTHLSRMAEENILWCSWEFRFVELDDAYSTGSSIMPQKKNPDVSELVRGKAGRVFGDLTALLTVMKGLPLAYNKDMQEDKEAVFDAVDTVKACLSVFAPMFSTMKVNRDRCLLAAKTGFINATDAADYLVRKGLAFRDAYTAVGKLVSYCSNACKTLDELTLDEFKSFSPKFDTDVYTALSLQKCVDERRVFGGPAAESVAKQIKSMEIFLNEI